MYERIHHLKFKPISFETELLGNPPFFEQSQGRDVT